MFSYFQNGIANVIPQKIIQLNQLIEIIGNNPQQDLIKKIRDMRLEGNKHYKVLKRKLSYITPNCVLRYRDLSKVNFEKNFIQASQYIYFDIDNIPDIDKYKTEFISNYQNLASLICKSSSGEGLSVLFKLENAISSKEEFLKIWNHIRTKILKNVNIDVTCKDLGRPMFISSDPDVFFNFKNEIKI
jgi:hypothetical protein